MLWPGMRTGVICLTVAVFAVSVWALIVRLAAPTVCLPLGVSSNYQYSGTLPEAAHDLTKMRRVGITTVREDFLWSTVQPTGPEQWNWATYDRLVSETSRLGITVLPIIDYGTVWASAPRPSSAMPSSKAGQHAFARYAAAVIGRYGPRGTFWPTHSSLPRLAITAVELWNEPWFASSASVNDYVTLLRLAGQAVHRQFKRGLVVANVDDRPVGDAATASTVPWGAAVLAHAQALGGVVDRWAIHPYPRDNPRNPAADAIDQVDWLRRLLVRHRLAGSVWITEIGFSIAAPRTSQSASQSFHLFVSSMARSYGPNRVTAVWAFTAARPTPKTQLGSFDFGYNLITAAGETTPALQAAGAARCVTK